MRYIRLVLHSSLLELAEQAPLCQDAPTLRGVLAEAADLARNAADHAADATDIAAWYSTLLRSALRSPAAHIIAPGGQLMLTGAAARDDALPPSPVAWLTLLDSEDTIPDTMPMTELMRGVGCVVLPSPYPAFTAAQWRDRIREACVHEDSAALGWLYDTGGWFGAAVVEAAWADGASRSKAADALLRQALQLRPPAVRVADGLPDRTVEIDLTRNLLHPLIRISRWAGLAAGCEGAHTRERLEHARRAGVLSWEETTSLAEAWRAGHALRLQRWVSGLGGRVCTLEDMPPLQRSTFGASCRAVADVTRAVAARHNVAA